MKRWGSKVWKYRRIAVSLANACSQKPALRYALAVECDVFEHPAHHGLSLIDAQCLKHGRHRKIYRAWRCAFFCADRSDESWIVKGRFVIQWKQAVQVSRGNGNFARLDRSNCRRPISIELEPVTLRNAAHSCARAH
jgi:hypothetical protein